MGCKGSRLHPVVQRFAYWIYSVAVRTYSSGMASAIKGRGAMSAPPGRFDKLTQTLEHDGWYEDEEPRRVETVVLPEPARSIISRNKSPDIGFSQSINPYRGCEHGCIYCYARPSHSYVGLSPGLDFETKLFYKHDAAKVLEQELAHPRYVCKHIMLGANTDPYQPIERRLQVTRSILTVLAKCRHPVSIVTKGVLVARDVDLLAEMASQRLVSVVMSLTTLDAEVKRTLEPRAASPQARLKVIRQLV